MFYRASEKARSLNLSYLFFAAYSVNNLPTFLRDWYSASEIQSFLVAFLKLLNSSITYSEPNCSSRLNLDFKPILARICSMD